MLPVCGPAIFPNGSSHELRRAFVIRLSSFWTERAKLSFRRGAWPEVTKHVGHVIDLSERDSRPPENRVGNHLVERRLRQCPVAHILLPCQVEDHSVGQLVRERRVGGIVKLIATHRRKRSRRFGQPGTRSHPSAWLFATLPALLPDLHHCLWDGLAAQAIDRLLCLEAQEPQLRRQREHIVRQPQSEKSIGILAALRGECFCLVEPSGDCAELVDERWN